MTTTVAKPETIRRPRIAAAQRLQRARRRPLMLAGITVTLGLAALAAWLTVDRFTGSSEKAVATASAAPPWNPGASLWLERLDVVGLEKQLVRAGYSLKVDGRLGAVTKSALADFLRPSSTHPLSPSLARALDGTVIRTLRNPAAWNSRFGLNRETKFVERPLTGPGGQLDANGNIRPPVLAVAVPPRAEAVRPKNGKIAFVDRTNALVAVNANGSRLRRLVRCPAAITDCGIGGYAWSPNGKQLAFMRGRLGIVVSDLSLYVINADGSGMRRLAHCVRCGPGTDRDSRVAWSPNGASIAFAGEDGLHLVGLSSGTQVLLTDSPGDVDPAWSPSGSKIAFGRGGSLYSIKSDGSGINELATVGGQVGHPAWAPDGTKIALDNLAAGPDGIYVVGADGSQLKLLRSGSRGSGPGTPSWSRDGRRILFFNTPGTPGAFRAEIWTMNPDGSNQRRLYRSARGVGEWYPPIWSPNGRWIAFSADSAGGVFVMDANGKHRRSLFRRPSEIAWQSAPRTR
jgi:Tol biopolymer transport system component